MPNPNQERTPTGKFGAPCAWYRHEVMAWVHSRLRADTRMPALPPPPIPEVPELMRWPEIARITSLKRWTAYDMERRGIFPKRVLLSAGTSLVDDQPSN
jgi:predicted DNA-binding transcriptional regulator AlpA